MTALAEVLSSNRRAWDHAAKSYEGCVLPCWGPFGECSQVDLLGSLVGKTVLEIGCGQGCSLSYTIAHGASKAYGVDFSATQIARAAEFNQTHIDTGRIRLFNSPMEERLDLGGIDIAFSNYALGWTLEPKRVFSNIASYLKTGGKLVWSWEHPLFWLMKYEEGKFRLQDSYLNEAVRCERWSGIDGVYMRTRAISSWFRDLVDAGFMVRDFLEPPPDFIANATDDPARYYSSAKARNVPGTMIFVCEKITA